MRKVPILTVLAVVAGLAAAPVQGATLFANDGAPDYALSGSTTGVIDLNDYFDSSAGPVSFTAVEGGSVDANGIGTIFVADGSYAFEGSDGTDTLQIGGSVVVSDFITGGPAIDNNNRLVGVAGGNPFVNALAPGVTVNSVEALGNLPSGGGGSPGGGTGAAGGAPLVGIGQVVLDVAPTGLRSRTSASLAVDAGSASASGLTASVDAAGNYSLVAGDDYAGTWVVTIGSSAGAVHLLAADSVAVPLSADAVTVAPAGTNPLAAVTFADGAATVSAAAGEGALVFANAPIATGADVTFSLNYTTDSTAVSIATIVFDGGIDGSVVQFSNSTAGNLEAGVEKNTAISYKSVSGNAFVGFQVFNGGSSAATVNINGCAVLLTGGLPDVALNPNATADLPVDGSIASLDGWVADILGAGAAAPALSTDNNFASPTSGGSISLVGTGGFANASVQVAAGVGTVAPECYVKRVGDAAAGSAFVLTLTDGAGLQIQSTLAGATISADAWQKVSISTSNSVARPVSFLVVQAAGFDALVDDVAIRIVDDQAGAFDGGLLQ